MYSKIDPSFQNYVQNSFVNGNDPAKSPGVDTESSNYSGYRGGKRRGRPAGRGRGRGRGSSLTLKSGEISLKYSQSGCSIPFHLKKSMAD